MVDDFFGSFGSDTGTVSDVVGDLGSVAIPAIDETAAAIPVDTNDNMLSRLFGSALAATTAIVDGAAQRITSSGDIIGRRIAQPTPKQGPKPLSILSSPIVLIVIVAFGTMLLMMFGRKM